MRYDLTTPCESCPFRKDVHMHLRPERVVEIVTGLFSDITFACHKTSTQIGRTSRHRDAKHCVGALIFLENHGHAHQMMRISERLGLYDHTKLDRSTPVYESMRDMIDGQES